MNYSDPSGHVRFSFGLYLPKKFGYAFDSSVSTGHCISIFGLYLLIYIEKGSFFLFLSYSSLHPYSTTRELLCKFAFCTKFVNYFLLF